MKAPELKPAPARDEIERAFLASDAARFVHGETIEVNGGLVCD